MHGAAVESHQNKGDNNPKLSQAGSEGVAVVTFFWISEALRPTTYVLHRQLDQALSSIFEVPTPLTV